MPESRKAGTAITGVVSISATMQPVGFQWAIVLWIAVISIVLGAAVWLNWKLKTHGDKKSGMKNAHRGRTIGGMAETDVAKPRPVPLYDSGASMPLAHPPGGPTETELVGSAREPRYSGSFHTQMRQQGGKPISVKVWDLSAGGFCAEWPHKLNAGDRVFFSVSGTAPQSAKVVWSHEFVVGCKFEARLHDAVLSLIVKRSGEDAAI